MTVTMTTADPARLAIGGSMTIGGVHVAGYDGTFTVTAVGSASNYQSHSVIVASVRWPLRVEQQQQVRRMHISECTLRRSVPNDSSSC